jgi:hypothetical protein
MPPIETTPTDRARLTLELQRQAEEQRQREAAAERQRQAQARAAQQQRQARQRAGLTDQVAPPRSSPAGLPNVSGTSLVVARPGVPGRFAPLDAPPTPAEQKASADAATVHAELKKSPQAAALKLAAFVEANRDPGYQATLIASTSDVTAEVALKAQAGRLSKGNLQAAVNSLSDAARACQPAEARALTDAFATGVQGGALGEGDNQLGGALRASVSAGHGALFGVELSKSLQAGGKNQTALEAAKFTTLGLQDARQSFEKARDTVNQLTSEVQGIAQDLAAAGRSQSEIAGVIADFKRRHADAFTAFEASGARLTSSLDGAAEEVKGAPIPGASPGFPPLSWGNALKTEAEAALKDLPDLAHTQAGTHALAGALAAQGQGQPNFLDAIPQVADDIRHDEGDAKANAFLDSVGAATLDSAGTAAAGYQQAGKAQMADAVLAGIAKNTKILRVDANTLAKITANLKTVKDAKGPEAIKAAYSALQDSTQGLPPKTALGLKGAGAALGVVSLIAGAPGLSKADLNQKLQYVLGATGTGIQVADVAGTAAGLVQKSAAFADFAGLAGKAVPGLTSAVSALSAIDEFSKGDVTSGAADTAVAVGAALLLTPPPGDIAGGVLIAAGTLVKLTKGFFSGEGDGAAEADTKAALIRLGVPEAKAEQLKDLEHGRHYIGQFIGLESKRLGVSPKVYLDWLTHLPDAELGRVMQTARGIDAPGGKLKAASQLSDPAVPPGSVEAADAFLVAQGLYPPSTPASYAQRVKAHSDADAQYRLAFMSPFGYQNVGRLLSRDTDPAFRSEIIRRLEESSGAHFADTVQVVVSRGGDKNAIRDSLQAARAEGVINDQQLNEALAKL